MTLSDRAQNPLALMSPADILQLSRDDLLDMFGYKGIWNDLGQYEAELAVESERERVSESLDLYDIEQAEIEALAAQLVDSPESWSLSDLIRALQAIGNVARRLLDSSDVDHHTQWQTTSNYEAELVQVAASAVAALEDLYLSRDSSASMRATIFEQISQERNRHDAKFGAMPRRLNPLVWIAVAVEELAEASDEILVQEGEC